MGFVVLSITRDVKDGVHQTKGWSNTGKDNSNNNVNNELFISYCILLHLSGLLRWWSREIQVFP